MEFPWNQPSSFFRRKNIQRFWNSKSKKQQMKTLSPNKNKKQKQPFELVWKKKQQNKNKKHLLGQKRGQTPKKTCVSGSTCQTHHQWPKPRSRGSMLLCCSLWRAGFNKILVLDHKTLDAWVCLVEAKGIRGKVACLAVVGGLRTLSQGGWPRWWAWQVQRLQHHWSLNNHFLYLA